MRERVIEISKKQGLTHLSSTLSCVETIERIFDMKKPDEKFVLSNGHAGLALYVVMEKHGLVDAEEAISKDIHANSEFCDVSTGSLGMGITIATGIAFSNRNRYTYCMVSDGEMSEGSVWEALRVAFEYNLTNLKIVLNANGWGAYKKIDVGRLSRQIRGFVDTVVEVDGHDGEQITKALETESKSGPLFIIAHTKNDPYPDSLEAHYCKA